MIAMCDFIQFFNEQSPLINMAVIAIPTRNLLDHATIDSVHTRNID